MSDRWIFHVRNVFFFLFIIKKKNELNIALLWYFLFIDYKVFNQFLECNEMKLLQISG